MDPLPSHGAKPAALPYSATTGATGSGGVVNVVFPLAGESSSIDTSPAQTGHRRSRRLAVHFSAETGNWRTPRTLWERLCKEFDFDLDVAATPDDRLIGERREGWDALLPLAQWGQRNYINPPYGNALRHWADCAYCHAKYNSEMVAMLLPARTDTRWWHEYVMHADEVRFFQGRLKFVAPDGTPMTSAPFPSCLAVWYPNIGYRQTASPRFSIFEW